MSLRKSKGGHGGGHEEESSERWLLTYADMITLLTAFFIMMYSMSVLNLEQFNKMAISIRSGFGGTLEGGGHSILNPSTGASMVPSILPESGISQTVQVAKQMEGYIKAHHLQNELHMAQTDDGLRITMMADGKVLFPAGTADLKPQAREVLDQLVRLVAKTDSHLLVEGHTDNRPIHTTRYPSNWELSTARAVTVVRYLIERGRLPAARLSAAGYADSKPVAPNTTPANRAANRRVEILIRMNRTAGRPGPPKGRARSTAAQPRTPAHDVQVREVTPSAALPERNATAEARPESS